MFLNLNIDVEATVAYAFSPVGLNTRGEGCYLQFRRATRATLWSSGVDEDLAILRGSLLCHAAVSITGESSLARAADQLGGAGTRGVRRNRWVRMGDLKDYAASSRRKNGAVNSCKREVAGFSPMLDALLADNMPLWTLIARPEWSLAELEALRPRIEEMQLPVPGLIFDEGSPEDMAKWDEVLDARLHWGMSALAFVTTMLFCLRRALVLGSLLDYGFAYYAMATTMRLITNGNVVEPRLLRMSTPPDRGVSLASPSYVHQQLIDRLILSSFWWRFGHILQNWFSRIRAVDPSSRAFKTQVMFLVGRFGAHEGLILRKGFPFAERINFVDHSYCFQTNQQLQWNLFIGGSVGSERECLAPFGSSTLSSPRTGQGIAVSGRHWLAG